MKKSTILSILLIAFNYTVTSQTTYTWNGGSGNWNVASNWTPVGVPGTLDNAIVGGSNSTVTLTSDVTVAGFELVGSTLTGDYNFTVTNLMTWNGGPIMGLGVIVIDAGATLYLSGGNQQTLRRDLINNGTTIWDAGNFALFDAAEFTNNGTFIDQHSGTEPISGGSYGCVFDNIGDYTKSGNTLTTLDLPFYNSGSLDLQGGILRLGREGTSTGSINVGNGSSLKIEGIPGCDISGPLTGAGTVEFWITTTIRGIYNITGSTVFANQTTTFDTSSTIVSLNNGQQLVVTGTVEFNTGDVIEIDSLHLNGYLQGSDSVIIVESMNWAGQVMQGSGITTIDLNATLRLSGGNQQTLRRDLINNGTTIWDAGNFALFDAAAFTNNGTFIDQHSGTEPISGGSYGCVFNNNGTYFKNSGGQSNVGLPFYNIPSSHIRGTGLLQITYTFTNEGTVSPGDSLGALSLNNNYPADSTSILNIEIGGSPASGMYDKLQINGAAILDGTLNISLANNFIPAIGDTFEVVTFSSYTGNFDIINGLNTGSGVSFDTLFNSTGLLLITTATSDVRENNNLIPEEYALAQNFPNPFNPSTTIQYHIPELSFISLKVYDVLGNEIIILVKEEKPAGTYGVEFDATGLPSGIYLYRMRAGDFLDTKKMILLK